MASHYPIMDSDVAMANATQSLPGNGNIPASSGETDVG